MDVFAKHTGFKIGRCPDRRLARQIHIQDENVLNRLTALVGDLLHDGLEQIKLYRDLCFLRIYIGECLLGVSIDPV